MHVISEENLTEAYFTPKALAQRWNITLHTLEQWRWKGRGPHFFKLGKCVRYPKAEIERIEENLTQTPLFEATDKRFLCIDFESLILREEEKTLRSIGTNDYLKEEKM